MPARFPENYKDAALRHWDDAEFLKGRRIAAADHHVGIAAECAIKHALGIPVPNKVKRFHMDCLWGAASAVLDPTRFSDLVARLGGTSPFDKWQIDDRYVDTTTLETDINTMDGGISRGQSRRDATAAILLETGLKP